MRGRGVPWRGDARRCTWKRWQIEVDRVRRIVAGATAKRCSGGRTQRRRGTRAGPRDALVVCRRSEGPSRRRTMDDVALDPRETLSPGRSRPAVVAGKKKESGLARRHSCGRPFASSARRPSRTYAGQVTPSWVIASAHEIVVDGDALVGCSSFSHGGRPSSRRAGSDTPVDVAAAEAPRAADRSHEPCCRLPARRRASELVTGKNDNEGEPIDADVAVTRRFHRRPGRIPAERRGSRAQRGEAGLRTTRRRSIRPSKALGECRRGWPPRKTQMRDRGLAHLLVITYRAGANLEYGADHARPGACVASNTRTRSRRGGEIAPTVKRGGKRREDSELRLSSLRRVVAGGGECVLVGLLACNASFRRQIA